MSFYFSIASFALHFVSSHTWLSHTNICFVTIPVSFELNQFWFYLFYFELTQLHHFEAILIVIRTLFLFNYFLFRRIPLLLFPIDMLLYPSTLLIISVILSQRRAYNLISSQDAKRVFLVAQFATIYGQIILVCGRTRTCLCQLLLEISFIFFLVVCFC